MSALLSTPIPVVTVTVTGVTVEPDGNDEGGFNLDLALDSPALAVLALGQNEHATAGAVAASILRSITRPVFAQNTNYLEFVGELGGAIEKALGASFTDFRLLDEGQLSEHAGIFLDDDDDDGVVHLSVWGVADSI